MPLGCEDDNDTSPPNVYITSPMELAVVSEIITIECIATDNDSIRMVELWIDSLATGVTDDTLPYELSWNTVPFQDSTEHSIMILAEDMSGNMSFSEPISVLVDNTNSNPQSIYIIHQTIYWVLKHS